MRTRHRGRRPCEDRGGDWSTPVTGPACYLKAPSLATHTGAEGIILPPHPKWGHGGLGRLGVFACAHWARNTS